MGNKNTPAVIGVQLELCGAQLHKTSSKKKPDKVALDPAQTESIRGFAEQIVKLLCERHNCTCKD
jgi:hypothetical protein